MDLLDPARILFEDPHLIAVNKPAPLLTQAPAGIPNLESLVKDYIRVKYAKPAGVYLGIPHRLDRPVSGVIVFARNTKAAQRVHIQFEEHTARKIYWACVEGEVAPESGTWEDWIRKVPDEAKAAIAAEGETGAKRARLSYRVLRKLDRGTLLELSPETGRMHQLRIQSASRGHPIWGDSLYAPAREFGPASDDPRGRVIALHARSLTIRHPFTKEELTFTAELPEYWPS
jgi:23S rRNA pseudouridine1911/1915/1917 synthase